MQLERVKNGHILDTNIKTGYTVYVNILACGARTEERKKGKHMRILTIVFLIYAGAEVLFLLSYLPRLRFWADAFRKDKPLCNPTKEKLAVLIPSRDESPDTARPLLASLLGQTYPRENFDVYLIVKHKDDPVIPLATDMLPGVLVRVVEGQTRKAEALDACLKGIFADAGHRYDAYVIVDADSFVAPDFLSELNNAAPGADIIIPRKRIKNWESSDRRCRSLCCNCSAMTYRAVDALGNKGKSRRGYVLTLCGQGMYIADRVLRPLGGYPFRSLTEDYEVAVECMRHGYVQRYCERAEVYSEEATTHREYNKRRKRWIAGVVSFGRTYGREMLRLTFGDGHVRRKNLQQLFGVVPLCAIFGGHIIAFLLYLVFAVAFLATGQMPSAYAALVCMGIPFLTAYLELFVFAVMTLLADRDINKMTRGEKAAYLFLSPFLTAEYIFIFFGALFSRDNGTWEPVKRIRM